jgi:hypothetical protein
MPRASLQLSATAPTNRRSALEILFFNVNVPGDVRRAG